MMMMMRKFDQDTDDIYNMMMMITLKDAHYKEDDYEIFKRGTIIRLILKIRYHYIYRYKNGLQSMEFKIMASHKINSFIRIKGTIIHNHIIICLEN